MNFNFDALRILIEYLEQHSPQGSVGVPFVLSEIFSGINRETTNLIWERYCRQRYELTRNTAVDLFAQWTGQHQLEWERRAAKFGPTIDSEWNILDFQTGGVPRIQAEPNDNGPIRNRICNDPSRNIHIEVKQGSSNNKRSAAKDNNSRRCRQHSGGHRPDRSENHDGEDPVTSLLLRILGLCRDIHMELLEKKQPGSKESVVCDVCASHNSDFRWSNNWHDKHWPRRGDYCISRFDEL